MAKGINSKALKDKLLKQWLSFKLHKQWLKNELNFPLHIQLGRPTDKELLHQYPQVQNWINDVSDLTKHPGVSLDFVQIHFQTMGRQNIPVAVRFEDMEALCRYLAKWQHWQQFVSDAKALSQTFSELTSWIQENPAQISQYQQQWPKLIAVCRYFQANHQPKLYLRQLDITDVDSKFIEQHKAILKSLLDRLLPCQAINPRYESLAEHGFEKRFGLRYQQPQIRIRLLDPLLSAEFSGLSDISMPLDQFARLDLMLDYVFITENKINGLAFPPVNNAIVILGLGYGIQSLKDVDWLKQHRLYYWGDVDTHGLAILSQLRSYYPKTYSLLMDQTTLLTCKSSWGTEPEQKVHKANTLPHLTEEEQTLYQQLKTHHWGTRVRLEQEYVPMAILEQQLKKLR